MNVTQIVIEMLEWDGRLRTLTFAPRTGVDLWIAMPTEYGDKRSTPFHILDRKHERELGRQMRKAKERTSQGFRVLTNGMYSFETTWRGIRTERTGLSCYALGLPPEAAPLEVVFSDPNAAAREYRYRSEYDQRENRIIYYLECRSSYGTFDLDARVAFKHDSHKCRSHVTEEGGGRYVPDIREMGRFAEHGPTGDRYMVQQFFEGSTAIAMGENSVLVNQSTVRGPVVGSVAGSVGAIGDGSTGTAEAALGSYLLAHITELQSELHRLLASTEVATDSATRKSVGAALEGVQKQDTPSVLRALKALGQRGYEIATDLGAKIVAELIGGQIGIR